MLPVLLITTSTAYFLGVVFAQMRLGRLNSRRQDTVLAVAGIPVGAAGFLGIYLLFT